MQDNNTFINTETLQPVTPAGLSGPRSQSSYTDPRVQQILSESFSGTFPLIQSTPNGPEYIQLDRKNRNLIAQATPVINIGDIPKGELLRLMEGWMRVRRRITEEQFPKEVQSILLNLKVPSPRSSIQRYLIYKKGEEKKLFVLWGYQSEKEPHIPLEKALSMFLDVPLGHLQSILTTSISKQTSSVTSAVNMNTSTVQYLSNPEQTPFQSEPNPEASKNNWKTAAVFVGAAFLTSASYLGYSYLSNKEKPIPTLHQNPQFLSIGPSLTPSQNFDNHQILITDETEENINRAPDPEFIKEIPEETTSEIIPFQSNTTLTDMIHSKENFKSLDKQKTTPNHKKTVSLNTMLKEPTEQAPSLQQMLKQ